MVGIWNVNSVEQEIYMFDKLDDKHSLWRTDAGCYRPDVESAGYQKALTGLTRRKADLVSGWWKPISRHTSGVVRMGTAWPSGESEEERTMTGDAGDGWQEPV